MVLDIIKKQWSMLQGAYICTKHLVHSVTNLLLSPVTNTGHHGDGVEGLVDKAELGGKRLVHLVGVVTEPKYVYINVCCFGGFPSLYFS